MNSNWELNHVGIVVKKKNKILHYLQGLGIGVSVGPQPLLPHLEGTTTVMMYRTLDGDPVSHSSSKRGAHTFFDAETQVGTCQLECIQPSPGNLIHAYLEAKGEGINHLCFNVPDPQVETDKLVAKGCDLVFSATNGDYIIENYLDTRKFGDIIISFRPMAGEWEKAWMANNMEHPMVNKWNFRGVGVTVKDLDKTVAYYESLGFPEVQSEVVVDSSETPDYRVNGEKPDTATRFKSRRVQVGPLQYEFVQPLEGNTIHTECLEKRGEGISNLAFTVGLRWREGKDSSHG